MSATEIAAMNALWTPALLALFIVALATLFYAAYSIDRDGRRDSRLPK